SLAGPTTHPMRIAIKNLLQADELFPVQHFKEYPGLGVTGNVNGKYLRVGTSSMLGIEEEQSGKGTRLYVEIEHKIKGYFELQQGLRPGIREMLQRLPKRIHSSLLSGDRKEQAHYFQKTLGLPLAARFEQSPHDKLDYIQ